MKMQMQPAWYLILGMALMVGAHLSFNIEIFAWIAYVPFLLYLHSTKGLKSRISFSLVYIITWCLIVLKIITDPIPVIMVPLFALPIALLQLPAYLIWARYRASKYGWLLFPSILVIMEWVQYTFTPFASWGVAAYTQANQLALLQTVSLFGMAGLSFLILWVNSAIAHSIMDRKVSYRILIPPVLVLLLVLSFGAIRYDLSRFADVSTIAVASVGTDSEVGAVPMPSLRVRRQNANVLFERTRKAATSQAELVVWNEGSTAVLPEEESEWIDSLVNLTRECEISLVASYILVLQEAPLLYENKFLLIRPDGEIVFTYFKHEPVPGEPAIRGSEPFEVYEMDGVKVGGAICYDFDFPYIAKGIASQNAAVVALPSSDWKGIDPIHTEMAAFRAIEQGFSLLRSTRFGLSAAISPFGEVVAQMSSFDGNDKIMLAHLPAEKRATLYSYIGDLFVYLNMVFLLWVGFGKTLFDTQLSRKGL